MKNRIRRTAGPASRPSRVSRSPAPADPGGTLRFLALSIVLTLATVHAPPRLLGLNLEQIGEDNLWNTELLDVESSQGRIAIPGGLGGTVLVDVRDPRDPAVVSQHIDEDCPYGRFYNTWLGDGLLVGAGRNCPLAILEVADAGHTLNVQSRYQTGAYSYEDVTKTGDLLVAAAHGDGIELIDVSNPSAPFPVGQIPLDNAWAVRVEGDYAYVADGGSGLTIVDISDPAHPTVAGRLQTEGSAKDVRVRNGYAFLVLGDAGLVMIDVSDPTAPFLAVGFDTGALAAHIGVTDSLIAVADWDDIEVFRYGPGGTLEQVGYRNSGGRVMGVEIEGDLLYVAEWDRLRIYRYGPVAGADLDIDLREIHFPRTDLGASVDTTVVLASHGLSALSVDSITIALSDFTVDPAPPFDVMPGEAQALRITYTPTRDDAGFQRLRIYTNDTDEPMTEVRVLGNNPDLNMGDPAPDFTLPVLDDGTFTPSEHRGSVIVLTFFASW